MPHIKKTDGEKVLVTKFIKQMSNMIIDSLENPESDVQKIFEAIASNIKDSSGDFYVCFGCSKAFTRSQLNEIVKNEKPKKMKFYQITGIWHPCSSNGNGLMLPTPGLFTRWNLLLAYAQEIFKVRSN